MGGIPYYASNENYTVYILNCSDTKVTLSVDEKEQSVEPTTKSISNLSEYIRAWKEDVYEGEEKSSGVFFFSKDELKDNFVFPVDISNEELLFDSNNSPSRITIEKNGDLVFSSKINQNLSEKKLLSSFDFTGVQLPYSKLNDDTILFSPETDKIIILALWDMEGHKTGYNEFEGTATSPKYVLIIPPDDKN